MKILRSGYPKPDKPRIEGVYAHWACGCIVRLESGDEALVDAYGGSLGVRFVDMTCPCCGRKVRLEEKREPEFP